ncbi:MAG: hypothetical protein ACRD1K_03605 [Acidimicrobiales bacterium]
MSIPDNRRVSALPSRRARGLAFACILLAGVCGGLIGSAFVDLQCETGCPGRAGLGGLVGAVTGAGGVAVVAVLVLRAMGEWNRIATSHDGDRDDSHTGSDDHPTA